MTVDVLFLSFRPMMGYGTTEIRCRQPVSFLMGAGWKAGAAHILAAPTTTCRLLVLHRVQHDALTEKIVALARSRGSKVAYDIDDFITDGPGAERFSPPVERAMRLADLVTVSGSFLMNKAAAVHSDCRIMSNKLSRSVLDQGRTAIAARSLPSRFVTIGYFSGSAHHDADFALIAPELFRLMKTCPDIRLTVGGKIEVDPVFRTFGERFVFEPFRPYAEFVGLLGGIDINLAPLDLSSDFARARSELKYLEGAAFGVPTVASPSPAFSETIVPGRTGFLCQPGEWFETLSRLVSDSSLRRSVGTAARAHVQTGYGPEAGQAEWDRLVHSILDTKPPVVANRLSDLSRELILTGQVRMRSARQALNSLLRRNGRTGRRKMPAE